MLQILIHLACLPPVEPSQSFADDIISSSSKIQDPPFDPAGLDPSVQSGELQNFLNFCALACTLSMLFDKIVQ